MIKKIKCFIAMMLCCILFTSCGGKTDTIVLTWMPTPNIQEQCDNYIEMGYFTNATYNEEEEKIYVDLTQKQKEKWLEESYQDIEKYTDESKENEHFYVEMSKDTKEFVVYGDSEMSFTKLAEYLDFIGFDAEVIQILNGADSWSFQFVIKDKRSGDELYTTVYPDEKIELSKEIWNK